MPTMTKPKQHKPRLTPELLRQAIAGDNTSLLGQVDQRFSVVRRLRTLQADFVYSHAGDDLPAGEYALACRAAYLTLMCEVAEAQWAARQIGKERPMLPTRADLATHSTMLNSLRRVVATLAEMHQARQQQRPSFMSELDATPAVLEERLRALGFVRQPDAHKTDFRVPLEIEEEGAPPNGSAIN